MGKVNLDDIKPGMKLEKDVQERSGRVLLRAGTEITERHLNIFRTWGVAEVDEALAQVKLLQGLLPICSYCKNIRDDNQLLAAD